MKNTLTRFWHARTKPNRDQYSRKPLDSILEYLRFIKAEAYIPKDARLLDIGTGDGNFLRYLKGHIAYAIGIDPHLSACVDYEGYHLISGYFPYNFKADTTYDVITIMATVEHIPMKVLPDVAEACWKHLKPGGHVIITVQHPRVDKLLDMLKAFRIVEGFSMHEHYGFDPECLPDIFNRWNLLKRKRWGFGLNNLFIFGKPISPSR